MVKFTLLYFTQKIYTLRTFCSCLLEYILIISAIACCRAACRTIYNRDKAQVSWRMLCTAGPERLNFITVNKSKTKVENDMQIASSQSMLKVYFLSIHVKDSFNISRSQRRTRGHSLPLNPPKVRQQCDHGCLKRQWLWSCNLGQCFHRPCLLTVINY